jgi:transglutaminase/protease-like cytokinesis protein 3
MRFILLFLFAWSIVSESVGQTPTSKPLSRVDSIVKSKKITTRDLEVLADTLLSSFPSDSEKVRAIYFWIAENIAYDHDKIQNTVQNQRGSLPEGMDQDQWEYKQVYNVVAKRKGVCADYTRLFQYLCEYYKIPCEYVTGYGYMGAGITKFLFLTGPESNHAWNAVMINKKWYLVDVTWASGNSLDNGKRTKGQRNDHYYLCPPEQFIKDHHPDDPRWQLLSQPLDPKEWVKQATGK